MNPFFFDEKRLEALASANSGRYQSADPCPHIYFDDFLPADVAKGMLAEFPSVDSTAWKNKYGDEHQFKMACEDSAQFPPHIRHMLSQFNSSVFVSFLEKLTGIEGLIPDPHYRGGGMHQIVPGGFLKVHVDFNWYPRLKLERRLNVLIYLNENWEEEYGGFFELWNKEMTKAEVKILPLFNRVAIFSTSEDSFHGHPDPLACPPGMTRKSLALYYYTSPATEDQAKAAAHSTLFFNRPGEEMKKTKKTSISKIRRFLSRYTPAFIKKILK